MFRDNKWSAKIQTHSRDDLLKVCAILARGIGKDHVVSQNVQVNILGTVHGGKSAIVDGLSAAFIDGRKPYKLPEKPLMEDSSGQAIQMDIKKVFAVNGSESLFTFSRKEFVRHSDLLKHYRKKLRHRFEGASGSGLDFHTTLHQKNRKADVFIRLDAPNYMDMDDWTRNWNIMIWSRSLKTPQMEQALGDLRGFHDNRQKRLFAGISRDVTHE